MERDRPSHERHRAEAPQSVSCRILSVSDTRSLETDRSGALIAELLEGEGHPVLGREIVPDEDRPIEKAALAALADPETEALLVTGGTGISPRDRTADVIDALCERKLPGYGELFRMLSWEEIGSAAMLSRAGAGVRAGRIIFVMPGSSAAVRLAMSKLILPELGHLLRELRKGT